MTDPLNDCRQGRALPRVQAAPMSELTRQALHTRLFPDQLCDIGDDLMLDRQRYRLIAVEHEGDGRVRHHLLPLP